MRVERILEKNIKRIDISDFLSEDLREKDDDGKLKPEYVTIKKLSNTVKKKIEFLSLNSLSGQTGKAILSYMKKKNVNPSDFDKMTGNEQAEILLDIKINTEDMKSIVEATIEVAKQTIDNGLDELDHTFTDNEGKKIKIGYDFLDALGNSQLINFLAEEIKRFAAGVFLGE